MVISGRPRRLTPEGKRGIEEFLKTENVHDYDPESGSNVAHVESPIATFDTEGLGYRLDDGRRGIIYAIGNHGADLDPGLIAGQEDAARVAGLFTPMSPDDRESRDRLVEELPGFLQLMFPAIPVLHEIDPTRQGQIYLEIKPEGVAVHTRMLAATHPDTAAQVLATTEQFRLERSRGWGHELHAILGSNVLDIQVRPADKGRPVTYLHEAFPHLSIACVGDDITDLAAMAELRGGDIMVTVGDRLRSAIRERRLDDDVELLELRDPFELAELLTEAAERCGS
ncbi:MAG TPA: hypothetical protein VHU91_01785 [Mycobacteriales bacterium]|nr:hypothetical protein [Mycobacteriales bacterium]